MEKPSKVEVGQRWQTSYGDVWCVISVDSPLRVRRERDGYECNTGLSWFANPHLTYLGPAEPVKAPAPAMEAKLDVWGDLVPVACLSCAGALDSTRAFVCQTCFPSVANNGKWVELRRAWQAGARDFPRPASPPSQPRTGPTSQTDSPREGSLSPARGLPATTEVRGRQSDKPPSPVRREPGELSARAILQSKERARQEKREADARAVAAFCDEWELLRDA